MTLSHQRMLLFTAYATVTFIVSAVFATAGHESAFAPMCIFYPWVRLLVEYGLIPETNLAVIPFASVYIFFLFLYGSLLVKLTNPIGLGLLHEGKAGLDAPELHLLENVIGEIQAAVIHPQPPGVDQGQAVSLHAVGFLPGDGRAAVELTQS